MIAMKFLGGGEGGGGGGQGSHNSYSMDLYNLTFLPS